MKETSEGDGTGLFGDAKIVLPPPGEPETKVLISRTHRSNKFYIQS